MARRTVARAPRSSAPAPGADIRDPHLRLPRPLRVARMAEAAFIVVTVYFALGVPGGAGEAERLVLLRLVFEATAALIVLLVLPWRPVPARIAAMVLAGFVLLGCIPGLAATLPALAGARAATWLTVLLDAAACASQGVVLAACASVRGDRLPPR